MRKTTTSQQFTKDLKQSSAEIKIVCRAGILLQIVKYV